MFINPVNKVLDKRPSPTFTRHVIWAWIRLTAPFHVPPHFFKPIPAHARLAKGWSRDVLASWCLTPQLGAVTILEPCDQCQDTKPLQELTKCGGIFAMGKKLRSQSLDHPIELRLGESCHEAIKFTALVVWATVTPLCVFVSSPLAGHLPHLVCNRTIDVMKHITRIPCPAIIRISSWSWQSKRIGSSQWRGRGCCCCCCCSCGHSSSRRSSRSSSRSSAIVIPSIGVHVFIICSYPSLLCSWAS